MLDWSESNCYSFSLERNFNIFLKSLPLWVFVSCWGPTAQNESKNKILKHQIISGDKLRMWQSLKL